jgi:branched-chain amino acid transport system permease protein
MPAFAMEYSILPLTSTVVGGAGTFVGAVVGSFILVPLSEAMREFGSLRVVLYSLMLLVFTVGLPEGIFRFAVRKYTQFQRLVPIEEPSPRAGAGRDPAAPAESTGATRASGS